MYTYEERIRTPILMKTFKSEQGTVSPHLFQDCSLDSCHDLIVIAIPEFLYFLPQLFFCKAELYVAAIQPACSLSLLSKACGKRLC